MSSVDTMHVLDPASLAAMQHLTQLQYQLIALRSLLPATITPLLSSTVSPSPEVLYSQFATSAASILATMKEFRTSWEDEETGCMLRQVRASMAKSGREGIGGCWWDSGMVSKDDNLYVLGADNRMEGVDTDSAMGCRSPELDWLDTLTNFKEKHAKHTVEFLERDQPIEVGVKADLLPLHFSLLGVKNSRGDVEYKITIAGSGKVQDSIARCLDARSHKTDLAYTLECVAAYCDLGSRKCDKCKRLLDSCALVSTNRRRSDAVGQNEAGAIWHAYHENCQP